MELRPVWARDEQTRPGRRGNPTLFLRRQQPIDQSLEHCQGQHRLQLRRPGQPDVCQLPGQPGHHAAIRRADRLTNMLDGAGTTAFAYYAGGLLHTEDGPWANDTVTYTYNNARLRSGLSLQQPTGTWTNGFGWDAAHRLSSVSSPAGTFSYA